MGTLLTIGNKDLADYIQRMTVEWYDVSDEESTVNAKGNLRYLPINDKYKIIIITRPMTASEMQTFFSVIPRSLLSVNYYNPYTASNRTATMYRGDRAIDFLWTTTQRGTLYEPMTISFIET